jgi:hypothetical protein
MLILDECDTRRVELRSNVCGMQATESKLVTSVPSLPPPISRTPPTSVPLEKQRNVGIAALHAHPPLSVCVLSPDLIAAIPASLSLDQSSCTQSGIQCLPFPQCLCAHSKGRPPQKRPILSHHLLTRTIDSRLPLSPFCCRAFFCPSTELRRSSITSRPLLNSRLEKNFLRCIPRRQP